MAKEELIEMHGVVQEVLPDSRFRVLLDNGHQLVSYTSGKMALDDKRATFVAPQERQKGHFRGPLCDRFASAWRVSATPVTGSGCRPLVRSVVVAAVIELSAGLVTGM